jgi:hypothetical protein
MFCWMKTATAFFLMMITDRSRNLWTGAQAPAECRSALGVDQDQAEKSKATADIFLMTLALRLGRTLHELRSTLTASELKMWIAYDR